MKKKFALGIVSTLLLTGNIVVPAYETEARTLQEMKDEKNQLQNQEGQIGSEIQNREQTMNELQQERAVLEEEVVQIQMNIDELKEQIDVQTVTLNDLNTEIVRLQDEIEVLTKLIAQREEKLRHQARAIQTQGNTTNMINVVIDSESLSDLISRLGVVSQLVGANKDIVQAQIDDQKQLNENETKLKTEKEQVEIVKAELEKNQQEMVVQKQALDNKIIQVAELYNLNAEEKEQFVKEQRVIAQRTSALNREIESEEKRIAEEKARKEAERKAAEERARKEAERKAAEERARKEAARKEASEKKAREEAARKAAEENKQKEQAAKNQAAARREADRKAEQERKAREQREREQQAAREREQKKQQQQQQQKPTSSSGFIRPTNGYVTSRYGYRFHPVHFSWRLHAGIDFGGGGPIVAVQSGTVTRAQYHSGWGYYVRINHGNGLETLYAHMQPNLRVSVGQRVSQGQQIGTMGTTGTSTGIHLHFEVFKNGRNVNPAPYLGL